MGSFVKFFPKNSTTTSDFGANLRIYHGGRFQTKKYKTEYIEGMLTMKLGVDELCYFNLVDIVKTDLECNEGFELWYRRFGLSLFAGRKKILSDKDIEDLMKTKDISGFVNVYVVHNDNEGPTNTNTPPLSHPPPTEENLLNPTSTLTKDNSSSKKSTSSSKKSASSPKKPASSKPKKTQLLRCKNPSYDTNIRQSKGKEPVVECGGEPDDEEGDSDSDNETGQCGNEDDAILTEGDSDNDVADDIFVDAATLDFTEDVEKGLGIIVSRSVEVEDVGDVDIEVEDEANLLSDEEELASEHGSDDESVIYPTFNPDSDFQRPIKLSLGLKFPNNKVFRKALRFHAVENEYDYYLLHNGRLRVSAYCRHRCNCEWVKGRGKFRACNCSDTVSKCRFKVNATKIKEEETFQIMGLRLTHNCGWIDFNKKCTAEYLAERYLEYWRLDCETKIDIFQKKVMSDIGVEIGYFKAYHAKAKALRKIYGLAADQYKLVLDYAETVRKYNPGSSMFVKLGSIERPPAVFQRMYMCLQACKEGWSAGCRPILGVDGCHLKGPFPGQLLTAVGKDGNCNIYPVAWAVVEVENTETWTWFLELLVNDLQPVSSNMTFMSDRQKGLVEALNRVVPNAEIRFCARHIWTNFRQTYPGEAYRQCFWKAAKAYTKTEFEQHMEAMRGLSEGAHAYLNSIPKNHWSKHAFSTKCKSSMLLNNVCESFNNALKKCRALPILSLMEWIRRYNMKRMYSKREGVEKLEGKFMPSVMKQLAKASKESYDCQLVQSGINTFEVDDKDDRYVVDLEKKSCGCFKWDLTGIPCGHAFGCIKKKRIPVDSFVDVAYTTEMYKKAYEPVINPIPGHKQWEKTPHTQPDPPPYRKMPGRPSLKRRRKEAGGKEDRQLVKKKKTTKICGNCGQSGHNKRGCKKPPTAVTNPPVGRKQRQRGSSTLTQEELPLTQGHPQGSQNSSIANASIVVEVPILQTE